MKDTDKKPQNELRTDRRRLLLGFGAAAGGSLALGCPVAHARSGEDQKYVTDAPTSRATSADRVPFHGAHQAGIVTPRPASGLVAAFNVVVQNPQDLENLLRGLTGRINYLMHGGKVAQVDPKLPPADSGILGPVAEPDNLTVTVSLGASLFTNRPWLKPLKPKTLQRMVQFPNDALDSRLCHGDVLLQFCANTQDTNIHALRDIIKHMSAHMVLRWSQDGNVPVVPPMPDGTTHSARNFLGFRDGSANPDSTDAALMQNVVWTGGDRGEPDWAHGGSYQAVRIIRNFVESWDRTPLGEQERIFGRMKISGAPLDGGESEHQRPDYSKDPKGEMTPLDAHIRLADPRTPGSRNDVLLRRPFNYSNGVTKSGHLEQGLLFICYQADLEKGFITVQNRLNGEPLEEYIKPVGGGYFYALPGAADRDDYLGRKLVEAARQEQTERS